MENQYEQNPNIDQMACGRCHKRANKYMCAAFIFTALSWCMKCKKKEHQALFFGQWVAPVLLLGIYKKLAKSQREKIKSDTVSGPEQMEEQDQHKQQDAAS